MFTSRHKRAHHQMHLNSSSSVYITSKRVEIAVFPIYQTASAICRRAAQVRHPKDRTRARSICLCLGSSNSSSLTPLPTTASGLVRMMGKAATVHARGPLVAATLFLPLTAALHYFQCFQCALPEIELSPPPHGRPLPCPVLSLLRGKRKAIEDAVAEEHSAEHCGILQSKLNAEIGGLLALALGSLCCTLFFSFSFSCSCSCSVIATVASSSVIGKTNLPTAKNCCCFIGGEC